MSDALRRDGCLSELELDCLLAGDDDPVLRRRLDACAHCQRRLAELEASRDAAMTPRHVSAQAAAILAGLGAAHAAPAPARWWSRRRTWLVGAPALSLAAAALVLVLVLWPRRGGDTTIAGDDEIRVKGGARLEVVLVEPEPPRAVADGEPVPPGATLSFRAVCPGGCAVALFAVGADGVTALADEVPPPWTIEAGAPVQLPVSVTVDHTDGEDRVLALFCVRPPDIATLRAALAQDSESSIAGCEARSHVVRRGSKP
jgi:hypothetical protein